MQTVSTKCINHLVEILKNEGVSILMIITDEKKLSDDIVIHYLKKKTYSIFKRGEGFNVNRISEKLFSNYIKN